MRGHLRRTLIFVGVLLGLFALTVCVLQSVCNSPAMTRKLNDILRENVDGNVRFSRVDVSFVRSFPRIRVTIDTLSLTYPHSRFADYDNDAGRLCSAGRGEVEDTLLVFDRFTACVNPWMLLDGKIYLHDARMHSLGLYAHNYGDSLNNWSIFKLKPSEEKKDTTRLSLPWISVSEVKLARSPKVVFTSSTDTVHLFANMRHFRVGGDVKIDEDGFRTRNVYLDLDTLRIGGRLPKDTLALSLDYLYLKERGRENFTLSAAAKLYAFTDLLGRVKIPVSLSSAFSLKSKEEQTKLDVDYLVANVAHIPVNVSGKLTLGGDATSLSGSMDISACRLDTLIREYCQSIDYIRDVRTDAVLDVKASFDGKLGKGLLPDAKCSVCVLPCNISYPPTGLLAKFATDVDAELTNTAKGQMMLSANLANLSLITSGFKLNASAKGSDLLGNASTYKANLSLNALLDSVFRKLPMEKEMTASGKLNLVASAGGRLSELKTFKFKTTKLSGSINADKILFGIPQDSLDLKVCNFSAGLGAKGTALSLNSTFDSLTFHLGQNDFAARLRGMDLGVDFGMVKVHDHKTAKFSARVGGKSVFLKYSDLRYGVRGIEVETAVVKRISALSQRRKAFLDSLRNVYPDIPRSELVSHMMKVNAQNNLPDYLKDKELYKYDLNVRMDSTMTSFFEEWMPSGRISVKSGFAAMPQLPLRTRLRGLRGSFNMSCMTLDTLGLSVGTSDMGVSGKLEGVRALLLGRKPMLKASLDLNSHRLNLNELISAVDLGRKTQIAAPVSENDESFVVDSLADKSTTIDQMGLFILPSNISFLMNISADSLNYSDIDVSPLKTSLQLQGRCVQLRDTKLNSNYGNMELDAYYSTISRKDISGGLHLNITDVSAQQIIHLMPSLDSLMPPLKTFRGKLGMKVSGTAAIDTCMNLVLPSVDGLLRISGTDLGIEDMGNFKKITRLLLFKNKNIGNIEDLSVDAVVHDNRVEVFPFILAADRYKCAMQGLYSMNGDMDYHISILKSPFPIKFGVDIFGSKDKWNYRICKARFRQGVPSYTRQLDSVQVNIYDYIHSIFTQKQGRSPYRSQFSAYGEKNRDEALTKEEFYKIEEMSFKNQAETENNELSMEIDALLEETSSYRKK